jgi:hypothetical protein
MCEEVRVCRGACARDHEHCFGEVVHEHVFGSEAGCVERNVVLQLQDVFGYSIEDMLRHLQGCGLSRLRACRDCTQQRCNAPRVLLVWI